MSLRQAIVALALFAAFMACFLGPLFAARRAQHWLKTHRPWIYAWRHLSEPERSWARCIASHETRGIPWRLKARTNTGNGYGGSTQWLPSTWHAAGGHGDVWDASLHEQLVRTVRWAHVAGSSQWSTSRYCGSVA